VSPGPCFVSEDAIEALGSEAVSTASLSIRAPLTRDLIIETAMEIIDREDLDGLTMRRLARELGVAAPAIYWHLRTRDEILQGVYDLAVSKVELSVSDGPSWMERVKAFSRAVRDMHRAHPFMFALAQKFGGRGAETTIDSFVATAPESGYRVADAVRIAWMFQTFAIGFAFFETSTASMLEGADAEIPKLLDEIGPQISPRLLSSLLVRYTMDSDALFEIGLESLARSLPETLRAYEQRSTSALEGEGLDESS